MIFGPLLSFLGGAAARAVIGKVIEYFERRQQHLQEQDSLRLQEEIDQKKHLRQKELIELQANLHLGEIKLVGETQLNLEEAKAFTEAMKVANQPTGVAWVDAWNGAIRPSAATCALALWVLKFIRSGFEITAFDENLICSVLGYFFADRHLGKK